MQQTNETINTSRTPVIDPTTALLVAAPLALTLAGNPNALTAIAITLTSLAGAEVLSRLAYRYAQKSAKAMSLEQLLSGAGVTLEPIEPWEPPVAVKFDSSDYDAKFASLRAAALARATELGKQYRARVRASVIGVSETSNGSPLQATPAALNA